MRRPRWAGPPLPVQGLHTGLPGAGGRGPRDPRGSPAPSRPRARTPGALAARRRRRLPVHGAPRPPPPPPPRGNRDQDQRSAGMPRRAPEALTAACRLRRSPPLAVTWRPCVTHKSARAGVGVGGVPRRGAALAARRPGVRSPLTLAHAHLCSGQGNRNREQRLEQLGRDPSHLGSQSTNGTERDLLSELPD